MDAGTNNTSTSGPASRDVAARLLTRTAAFLQRSSTRLSNSLPVEPEPADAVVADLPHSFEDVAGSALASATPEQTVSILAISVDYFDIVTASHGHDIAGEVMAAVSERISDVQRESDALTMCSDDSYAVLWIADHGSVDAADLALRIANQFNEPIQTSVGHVPTTASIGVASASGEKCASTSPQTLQRQAMSAARSAQRKGRGQLVRFDHMIEKQAIESYETERKLRTAIDNDRLDIAYQPIVSLHSGAVVGVEALARWHDDTLGSIDPTTFIHIAEETGLMGSLSNRILRSAIAQGGRWNNGDRQGDRPMMLTINLSNRQLLDPELIPTIDALLSENGLAPRQLCLEIAESVVMSDVAASMTILGHMKDLGLCLAIDDFGTGYSSLSYLRQLPVDILKIDQSFVQSIYNRDDRVVTKAIIDLAHTLGMTTVAEGVETRLQAEVLHALNCDMAQGFYLQAPAPPEQISFASIDFEAAANENHGSPSAPAAITDTYARQ